MNLKDKFIKAERYSLLRTTLVEECEKIADEFAIGFAEWMEYGSEYVDNTERGKVYYYRKKLYTTQ